MIYSAFLIIFQQLVNIRKELHRLVNIGKELYRLVNIGKEL